MASSAAAADQSAGYPATSSQAPQTAPGISADAPVSPKLPISRSSMTSQREAAQHFQGDLERTSTSASKASVTASRLRSASLRLMEADVPLGMWAASASVTSKAPSLADIRCGSYTERGWSPKGQLDEERRASVGMGTGKGRYLSRTNSGPSVRSLGHPEDRFQRVGTNSTEPFPSVIEERAPEESKETRAALPAEKNAADGVIYEERSSDSVAGDRFPPHPTSKSKRHHKDKEIFPADIAQPNGYAPPPKLPWSTSLQIGLRAFWRWFLTPLGFLITVYGLNVVAWGGMLFLLLCNAAPAMCHPTCNDLYSPRRIWLEIDSQILNALFCVTGFGLIPWRFRDLYWLLAFRLGRSRERKTRALRRLAGIHRGWFRLSGAQDWQAEQHAADSDLLADPAIPLPLAKRLEPPLTGIRAPPTAPWKLDFVIWANVANTFLQACLCGFMWGLTRFTRPSWATGLFIGLACVVAGAAGILMFVEGKKVKRFEGVPPNEEQLTLMQREREEDQEKASGSVKEKEMDVQATLDKGAETREKSGQTLPAEAQV